jgi:hypothetical protein
MKKLFFFLAPVVIILVAVFFWPTLYEYREITIMGQEHPTRVNRITGHVEVFYPGGWRELFGGGHLKEMTADELADLKQGRAMFHNLAFYASIYNGTAKELRSVNISLVVFNDAGLEVSRREYRLTPYTPGAGQPFSDGIFLGDISFRPIHDLNGQ